MAGDGSAAPNELAADVVNSVGLIDELRTEHRLIDTMVGAFRTWVERRLRGELDGADGLGFVNFFRVFADRYHHAREEDVLLPALVKHCEVPADHGPVVAIRLDHEEIRGMFGEIVLRLDGPFDLAEGAALQEIVDRWSYRMWAHIDAEDSVLLPEANERLRRAGVTELDAREPDEEERAIRDAAWALVAAHPPGPAQAMRGEGCVFCPQYGENCDGIEREWWGEHEWEDFFHRAQ